MSPRSYTGQLDRARSTQKRLKCSKLEAYIVKNRGEWGILLGDKLKIKCIHEAAVLPTRANESDAGMDLYAIEDQLIEPGEAALIATGIQIELPRGTEAQIRPRSGLALKHSITVLNSPGTIDEGYRGEVKVILINHGKAAFQVEKGMRIAQMVVAPVLAIEVVQVEELSATIRDKGGFGSSGL